MTYDPVLWGAKVVLRYLREVHDISVCRDTLYRIAKRKENRFPLKHRVISARVHVTASRVDVDAWVERNNARGGRSRPKDDQTQNYTV